MNQRAPAIPEHIAAGNSRNHPLFMSRPLASRAGVVLWTRWDEKSKRQIQ